MASRLRVWWDGDLVGELDRGGGGAMYFQYDASWLGRADARSLSISLPLDDALYAAPARNWFANLLPEGAAREAIARALGVAVDDDFGLLEHLGSVLLLRPPCPLRSEVRAVSSWRLLPTGATIQAMATLEQLRARREELLALAYRCGARNVRVFGFVARGTAGPDSDIDFRVEVEPGASLLELGELYLDLQDLLGVPVDLVTDKGLNPRLRDRILAEAVPL